VDWIPVEQQLQVHGGPAHHCPKPNRRLCSMAHAQQGCMHHPNRAGLHAPPKPPPGLGPGPARLARIRQPLSRSRSRSCIAGHGRKQDWLKGCRLRACSASLSLSRSERLAASVASAAAKRAAAALTPWMTGSSGPKAPADGGLLAPMAARGRGRGTKRSGPARAC
jgi:hypothetical protein